MNTPLQILIAEDNPADAELILRELRRSGYEPKGERVDNQADFRARLHPHLDIILSDYDMPQFGGPRALELLQECGLDIPFIIISGTIGEDTAVAAMKLGAADYLLKDRLTRLGSAVGHALAESRLRRERQQAVEQLRASEQQFSSAFAYAATGAALVALDGHYLKVNRALCQMLGYSEAELLSRTFQDISHPDELETKLENLRQLLAGNIESFQMEKRYLHQQGHAVWGLLSVSLVRDEQGDPVRFIAQMQDITERKRAEAALRASEERLRLITNLVPHGIFAKDAGGRYIFANRALAEVCGLPVEEVLGKTDFDLVADKAQAAAFRADDLAVIESGIEKFVPEEPLTNSSGQTRILQTIKIPFTVPETGERAVLGVWVDITGRKRAEERVREQAAMLDQAHDAIIVRSFHDRKITFWNQGAQSLYGWATGEAIGQEIGELICAEADIPDKIRDALLTNEWRGETRHKTKDGKLLIVNTRETLVRDEAGNPKSVLSINTDITEQKALEARYLRAQRMESIGTLASGVAHDLNNILAPIMMSAPILRRELSDEQREQIVTTIEMSAARGAQIVKQVLTFGRGLEGDRCPLHVDFLIKEVMEIVRGTFPKNIAERCSIEADLWPVLGDATQLHQVLLNLCVNGRDAMPDGGRLFLRAANLDLDASYASMVPEALPGAYVLLEVTDTGGGIPPETLKRIFDPFFTTKGIGHGTGLGLSTTLGIVKSHGGFIQVNTQPGKGSTFQVYLPASPDHEVSPPDPRPAHVPEGHGELILVVDDEPSVSGAARLALETAGYRVILAGDGTEALAVFAMNSGSVAVVLTDLMMPFMDGVALTRALRMLKPTLPIIASTGLGERTQITELLAMNVETILHKPYGADMLLRTIHEALHPPALTPA